MKLTVSELQEVEKEFCALVRLSKMISGDNVDAVIAAAISYRKMTGRDVLGLLGLAASIDASGNSVIISTTPTQQR